MPNSLNMLRYDNCVALITGAMGTIGKSFTTYLLENNIKGIALVDIQNDNAYLNELEVKYKNKCIVIPTNVQNKKEIKDAFEETVKHFGQLDIVINNAGVPEIDNYELIMDVNFMAVLHGTVMALCDYLPKYKKGSGVIVNVSSILGVYPAWCLPLYSISKHAVAAIGMCYEKHPDCLKHDIRILTLCPSATISGMYTHDDHSFMMNSTLPEEKHLPANESPDYLGKGLIKMINEGENGAVWIFDGDKNPCKIDYHVNQKIALNHLLE